MLAYLLLLVGSTAAAVPEKYMTVYHSQHGPLTAVIVDSMERVIVGGRNVLLQFDDGNVCPDTTLQHVQPSQCMGPSCNTSFYNDVLILQALPMNNSLSILFCGTLNHGQCFLLDKENITSHIEIKKTLESLVNNSGAHLGGRSSAIAIPISKKPDYPSSFDVFFGIDTMIGYVFSERKLTRYNDEYDMYYTDTSSMPYIKAKKDYTAEFVHGFRAENLVYFLWNLQTPHGIKSARLSQMCEKDKHFMSYIESEISCGKYSIVTSAVTHSFTNERTGSKKYVFVTFSSLRHAGSALCIYDVSDDTTAVPKHFQQALTECFRKAKGSRPEWIVGNETSCTQLKPDANLACTANKHTNGRIQTHTVLNQHQPVIVERTRDMTSVLVAMTGNKHIAYIGYNDGSLSKEIIDIEIQERTFLYNVLIPGASSINRNMALTESGNKLFFTYDDKVAMLTVDACGLHTSCLSCLSDVIDCVWFAPSPYQTGECLSPDATNGLDYKKIHNHLSCPVVLTDVTPKIGPTAGGTRVTLTGHFGSTDGIIDIYFNTDDKGDTDDKGPDSSRLIIGQQTSNRIVCVTPAVPRPMAHTLYMEVKSTSYVTIAHVEGKIQFRDTFQFLEPTINLDELRPRRVKISGDVQVRFTGTHLAIANRTNVQVGNQTCTITPSDTHENHEITCRAPAQENTGEYSTEIHVDGAVLSGPPVMYVDEPVLQTISPQRTIHSGGLPLTIYGEHLDGLGQPLYLTYRHDNGTILNYYTSGNCQINSSAMLVCMAPNIHTTDAFPSDVILMFFNQYGHINTTAVNVTLVPDPLVHSFQETLYIDQQVRRITIKGDNLTNVDIEDIQVKVGAHTCRVTRLNRKDILCRLDGASVPTGKLLRTTVQVGEHFLQTVGNVVVQKSVNTLAPVADLGNSYTGFLVAGIIIACIVVVVAGCFATKKLLASNMCRKAEEHYNVTFRPGRDIPTLDGLSENNTTDISQNRQNAYQEQTFLKSTPENSVDKETAPLLPVIDEETRTMLIRQHLLIDAGCLVLGEVIGQGHFGCVFKAYLQQATEKQETIVAGKTLHRTNPSELDVQTFLKEALIMKDFHHRNVMELLGICLGMDALPVVVLPYMPRGDLLTYLRDPNNVPTVKDLVLFSVDIANGMHYLSQLKFVHRDLAARNCMIGDDLTVKVADFGLSRDVYEKQYYSSKDKTTKLPVKWMSPESLEFNVYSSKTDMWSYGIVMWELLTRGMFPYPGVDNWDILRYLTEGRRMDKPQYCPEEIYYIMQRCWSWEPNERPSFGQLTIEIPQLIDRLDRSTGDITRRFNTEITYVNCNQALKKMS